MAKDDTEISNGPADFSLDMVSSPVKSKFVATSEIAVSFGSATDSSSSASEWPQLELLKLDRMQDALDKMPSQGVQGTNLVSNHGIKLPRLTIG